METLLTEIMNVRELRGYCRPGGKRSYLFRISRRLGQEERVAVETALALRFRKKGKSLHRKFAILVRDLCMKLRLYSALNTA